MTLRYEGTLEIVEYDLVKDYEPPAINSTFGLPKMVDARFAEWAVIWVVNSGDQAITVQPVAHHTDAGQDINGLVDVGSSKVIAAGSSTVQKLAVTWEFPGSQFPFVGVTVAIGGTLFTTGSLHVFAQARIKGSLTDPRKAGTTPDAGSSVIGGGTGDFIITRDSRKASAGKTKDQEKEDKRLAEVSQLNPEELMALRALIGTGGPQGVFRRG